jgi:hypothetical protein
MDTRDLTRFKMYAPFVKSLEIYGEHARNYETTNWQALAAYAKNTTLLPNLVRLTLTAPFPISSRNQLLWIRTFLGPSLLEIQVIKMGSSFPSVSFPVASCLLKHISSISPRVQRFSIFIEPEASHGPEEDSVMMGFWEPPLHGYFKNLLALQELTCTEIILQPEAFPSITQLPLLERLEIWVDGEDMGIWKSVDPKSLPPNPFPSLRTFSLRRADAGEAFIVLECPAFKNLSSLYIGLDHWPDDPEDEHWEQQLIDLIARFCPRLTSLSIDFDENDNYPHTLRNLTEPTTNGDSALSSMSRLPLQTVCLTKAIVGDNVEDSVDADDLKAAWPLVTTLHMPHVLGPFGILCEFSQMPNLQQLTLHLVLDSLHLDDDFFAQPPGSLSLHTLESSFAMELEDRLDIIARCVILIRYMHTS